jgi:hypothetical protein
MYRLVLVGSLAVASMLSLLPATAHAQGGVRRRSLGGYGSATITRYYRSGGGGTFLPSAGGFGSFIAERALESRPSAVAAMTPQQIERTPIGGMGGVRTPIGGASLMPGRRFPAFGTRGAMGIGGVIRSPAAGRRMVTPPRLGSPFGPPSVLGGGG